MMKPLRPWPDVLRDWAPELEQKLGRSQGEILSKGLSAYDFSINRWVEIWHPDNSVYMTFKFAFAVLRPERKQAAVFSEHDGYVEFDLVEDAVVAEVHQTVYRQE